jgi:hypothetical protein
MNIYANEITRGEFTRLTSSSSRLIQNVLEYVVSAEAPNLSPGLYRLFTVIALGAPNLMGGSYGNTIIQVL